MNYKGIIPILPTPFDAQELIDFEDLHRLVDFAIQADVNAIGVPAFGSEFYKLSGGERGELISTVIKHVDGRKPVIVQCNHTAPNVVADMARDAESQGASAINVALPRAFPCSDNQLLNFAQTVCKSVSLPVILQDWNPGGPTIGVEFVKALHASCPNFRYIKYEEPGIAKLIREIDIATQGLVKTFTGWGGTHMLELIPCGSVAVMPGFSLIDYFQKIWNSLANQQMEEAYRLFARILPYISFSLQNLEQFHHVEKQLLKRRGLLKSATVRSVTIEILPDTQSYLDLILDQTLTALEEEGIACYQGDEIQDSKIVNKSIDI